MPEAPNKRSDPAAERMAPCRNPPCKRSNPMTERMDHMAWTTAALFNQLARRQEYMMDSMAARSAKLLDHVSSQLADLQIQQPADFPGPTPHKSHPTQQLRRRRSVVHSDPGARPRYYQEREETDRSTRSCPNMSRVFNYNPSPRVIHPPS